MKTSRPRARVAHEQHRRGQARGAGLGHARSMAAPALHVEAAGQGPGIVLAHGFGGSARNWRPQLRALRARFRVVVYDARGHARSEAPREPSAYREAELRRRPRARRARDGRRAARRGRPLDGRRGRAALRARAPGARARARAGLASGRARRAGAASRRTRSPSRTRSSATASRRRARASSGGRGSGLDPAGAALVRQGFLEHAPHALAHTLREFLAQLEPVEALAERLAGLALPALLIAGGRDEASLPVCRALARAAAGRAARDPGRRPRREPRGARGLRRGAARLPRAGHGRPERAGAAHRAADLRRRDPRAVDELAERIARDYRDAPLTLICIAEGARRFTDDLLARLVARGRAARAARRARAPQRRHLARSRHDRPLRPRAARGPRRARARRHRGRGRDAARACSRSRRSASRAR